MKLDREHWNANLLRTDGDAFRVDTSLGAYPPDHRFPGALEKGRHTSEHGGYVFDHPWVKDDRELPSWRRAAI